MIKDDNKMFEAGKQTQSVLETMSVFVEEWTDGESNNKPMQDTEAH